MRYEDYIKEMTTNLEERNKLRESVEREWWPDVLWQIKATHDSFQFYWWTTDGGAHDPHPNDILAGKRLEATTYYYRQWKAWREGKSAELPPSTSRPHFHFKYSKHHTWDVDMDCYYDEQRPKHEGEPKYSLAACAFNKDRPTQSGPEE